MEYGLIISLVVLAMVGALVVLADANSGQWNDVANQVEDASN